MGSLRDGSAQGRLLLRIVLPQDVQERIHQRHLDRVLIESLTQLVIDVLTPGCLLVDGVYQG